MNVCVCLSGADGRVVEGRATLFRHHRKVSRVRIPGRMGLPWMLCVVVFVLCRPEKGEERGWAWVAGERGKVPRSPAAPQERRQKHKNKPTVKVPDRPSKVKGERLKKKKDCASSKSSYATVFKFRSKKIRMHE
jgi:hypothetical protein